MYPFLKPGDYVLVFRTSRVRPGDVVLLHHPVSREKMVKRVKTIGEDGKILVIGDNAPFSVDSRHFGPVTRNHLIGKVIWVIRRL